MKTCQPLARLAHAGIYGLLWVLMGPALAFGDDSQYPIEIAADSAVREEPSGKRCTEVM